MSTDHPHNLPPGSEQLLREAARRQGRIEADLQAAQDQPPVSGDLWILPEPTEALLGEPPNEELLAAHDDADVEWLVAEADLGDSKNPTTLTLLAVDLMPLAASLDLPLEAKDGGPMVLRGGRSYRVPAALVAAGTRTGRLSASGLQRVHLHLQSLQDEAPTADPEDEEYDLDPEYRAWFDEVLTPAHHLITTLASKLSQRGADSAATPGDPGSSSSEANAKSTGTPSPSPSPPSPISRQRSKPQERGGNQSTPWHSRPSLLAATLILGLATGYLFSAQQSRQQISELSSQLASQRTTAFDIAGTVTLEPGITVRSDPFLLRAAPTQPRQINVIVSSRLTATNSLGITVLDAEDNVIAERRQVKIDNRFSTTLRFSADDMPYGDYKLELRHGVNKEILGTQSFVVVPAQPSDSSPESPSSPP
ncbi:MAG: hypothetical protein AAGD01_17605 [Acidobacteriota bacterium]